MTRDEILETAAQIFSQKGFHATSMQDIADAVNLQKASLYHHISSKQEILVEVLDKALDLLIARMEGVMAGTPPPDMALRRAMSIYLTTLLERRDLAAVLLLEHRSLEPEYHARHIPRRDRFERLWRDLIQQGLDAHLFTCSDPAMASRALLGVMNWTITWYRPDGSLSAEDIADQFTDLFLNGLLVRTVQVAHIQDAENDIPDHPINPVPDCPNKES
jgi:TetR/AcrR family transcriptional regulator, cholesterol catabolism regulator